MSAFGLAGRAVGQQLSQSVSPAWRSMTLTRHSWLSLLTLVGCARSAPTSSTAADSATQFTRTFYEWYLPQGTRFDVAVRDSSRLFAPALLAALRADLDAQSRDSEEVVGLDWDPFLASQDPCESYRVGKATARETDYLVEVYPSCPSSDQPTDKPVVLAEVGHHNGAWVFANFRYPADSGDLLTDLARLQAARDSTARGHR